MRPVVIYSSIMQVGRWEKFLEKLWPACLIGSINND